jgi:hypothetical protein
MKDAAIRNSVSWAQKCSRVSQGFARYDCIAIPTKPHSWYGLSIRGYDGGGIRKEHASSHTPDICFHVQIERASRTRVWSRSTLPLLLRMNRDSLHVQQAGVADGSMSRLASGSRFTIVFLRIQVFL